MPLLKPSAKPVKEQVRIYIESDVVQQMRDYCQWAGLGKIDEFIEQAALLVLEKDKEWQKALKAQRAGG